MKYLGVIDLDSSSIERSCNWKQMCFLSKRQVGEIGDVFSLEYNDKNNNFQIIDIWYSPKDFAQKFIWRMCGLSSSDELVKLLETYEDDQIYIHIFHPVHWGNVKDLVI